MKSGISILHFEDQHGDITPVVFEIYLILRSEAFTCYGSGDFQMLTDKKSDDLTVFDLLDVRDQKVPPIRYIVTSRPSYDAELSSLIAERSIFVLDAWRENAETGALESNIETTFSSLLGVYANIEDVVIYTAYPGNRKRLEGSEVPIEFTKAGQQELETYLVDNILGVWRSD